MAIREEANIPIAERLRMMSDERREAYWPNRTTDEMKQLWNAPDRFNLLPPSERRIRSRCCAEIASFVKGQEPRCHKCGRIANNIQEPEDQARNAYVQGEDA